MRLGTKYDKDLVEKIISITFAKNPGVNWLLRKGGDRNKKIGRLANWVFIKAFLRSGIFISSNEKGLAVCYKFNNNKFSIIEIYYQLRFVFTSINLSRLVKVLRRESYRKNIRPKSGEYLYFWFFGVLPGGEKAGFELKDAIFDKAKEVNLPVYLETAVKRNKIIYERYGFKTYHYWLDEKEDIEFWFMKWKP